MSQIIEAFEKYFRCVKQNMPTVVQNCTPPQDRVKAIGRGKKKFSNKFQFMLKDLPFVV